ncbi:MAG TPA: HAD-IB family phosphatase [Allosphingosinicella sp.]
MGDSSEEVNGRARSGPAAAGRWTAIILAGSRPGRDPLAHHFAVPAKAMIRVAGEPMVGRVVRTLLDCPSIGRVMVLAQEPQRLGEGELAWLAAEPRVAFAASGARIAGSVGGLLGTEAAPWPALITTGDHPLLTREMVEHFLAASAGADATVGVVERDVMLAQYPDAKRTWLRFRGGAYTGANLFTFQHARAQRLIDLFGRAESDRKRRLRLLWHFGPALALGAATRTVSLDEGIARAGRSLGVKVAAVPLPFAEAGIDVDRIADHALAERILAKRAERRAGPAAAVSVFDLDRTLTRRGTFTAFLLYAAARRAPWRLLLAPAAAYHFARHAAGGTSRKALKERLQRLFLGERVPRREIAAIAADYAARLRRRGFYRQGLKQIEQERRQGRRVLLATAANAFYAEAIARELGVEEIVCTRSAWDGDHLLARIDGPNCYGEDKLELLRAHLERPEAPRSTIHVRFFSDHSSDECLMRWADQAFVVNPQRRFRAYAGEMGWPVLSWP